MKNEICIEGIEDAPICHYLSLSKLLRLITESAIFFPKLELFRQSDPYECTLWPPDRYAGESLTELQSWAATIAMIHSSPSSHSVNERVTNIQRVRKEILSADADIESVRELIKAFEIREWADGVICNCWHLNTEESDAMWKIYSGRNGAAIFTTVKQLANGLSGFVKTDSYEKNTRWKIAPVIYRNEDELKNLPQFYIKHPWLLKRRAFEHEKELRVFKELPGAGRNGCGRDVRMDPSIFINKIYLSPFNAEWENEAIQTALKELWAKRFATTPAIQVSRHLNPDHPTAKILAKVQEITEREETLDMQKTLMRLPAKLLLRGRTTHASDEDWILHSIDQLLRIWDTMPNGVSQIALLEEFREILKSTRNENAAREAWNKLGIIHQTVFASNPEGDKVSSEPLADVARFLQDNLKHKIG